MGLIRRVGELDAWDQFRLKPETKAMRCAGLLDHPCTSFMLLDPNALPPMQTLIRALTVREDCQHSSGKNKDLLLDRPLLPKDAHGPKLLMSAPAGDVERAAAQPGVGLQAGTVCFEDRA